MAGLAARVAVDVLVALVAPVALVALVAFVALAGLVALAALVVVTDRVDFAVPAVRAAVLPAFAGVALAGRAVFTALETAFVALAAARPTLAGADLAARVAFAGLAARDALVLVVLVALVALVGLAGLADLVAPAGLAALAGDFLAATALAGVALRVGAFAAVRFTGLPAAVRGVLVAATYTLSILRVGGRAHA